MNASLTKAGSVRACPGCGKPLSEGRNTHGIFWHCPACDGRLASLAMLRKTVLQQAVNEVWQEAHDGESAPGKPCPECRQLMREVRIRTSDGTVMNVDVCTQCTLVWFDPREYDAMPQKPEESAPKEEELPEEAKEALAMAQVQAIRERFDSEYPDHPPRIRTSWMGILDLLCLLLKRP